MIKYFQTLPKEFYFQGDEASSLDIVTNITSLVSLNEDLKTNGVVFYDYLVEDGDTPEILAHKFYGNSNRHWMVLMMNDIVHPQFDWPLSMNSLELYIDKKYEVQSNNTMSGLEWAKNNIKTYYKVVRKRNLVSKENQIQYIEIDGSTHANTNYVKNEYTLKNGNRIDIESDATHITYYTYEIFENDKKRKIKMLKPEYVEMVENELQDKFTV
jgi:hypothetical protein